MLFVAAFALGIEVGPSDREILDHHGDSGHRTRELVAFFLIAAASLALIIFATALRSIIARAEQETGMLAALAWAGGIASAALLLAGNALSRATAFAAMDDEFQLDPTRAASSRTPASCSLRAARSRPSSSSWPSRSLRCGTACCRAGLPGRAFLPPRYSRSRSGSSASSPLWARLLAAGAALAFRRSRPTAMGADAAS